MFYKANVTVFMSKTQFPYKNSMFEKSISIIKLTETEYPFGNL